MEKIAIGSSFPENLIDLDFGVKKNIERLADAKNTSPDKLTACVLERPRHDQIVDSLNSLGVKINFITDGDITGVISCLLYTSPSPRDRTRSRMPSSA